MKAMERLVDEQIKQGKDIASIQSDLKNLVGWTKEIKTQVTKTNGTLGNHESRISKIESAGKTEDKLTGWDFKKKDLLMAVIMLIAIVALKFI